MLARLLFYFELSPTRMLSTQAACISLVSPSQTRSSRIEVNEVRLPGMQQGHLLRTSPYIPRQKLILSASSFTYIDSWNSFDDLEKL